MRLPISWRVRLISQLIVPVLAASWLPAQEVDVSRLATQETKAALSSRDVAGLEEEVRSVCDAYFHSAQDPDATIAARAAAATGAATCVERSRALLSAMSSDHELRARVRETLQPLDETAQKLKKETTSQVDFMGLGWGLGFGFSDGSDDAVDGAAIVNGIVRVSSEKKQQPRAVLEFHKYFWCNRHGTDGTRGCGPFVAVAATADKVLSGVGVGLMYGLKAKASDSDGFSLGVGAILDGKVKDLAEGFRRDEPAPAGETAVRFEEKARWSLLVFVTRTF